MFVLLGVQLAFAVAVVVFIVGLANAMSAHSVPFAHDDVPLLFPLGTVLVLGGLALVLWDRNRTAATILSLLPMPVALALMLWAWA
jgi:predicted phage tail protein